jgi:hypothetical protein
VDLWELLDEAAHVQHPCRTSHVLPPQSCTEYREQIHKIAEGWWLCSISHPLCSGTHQTAHASCAHQVGSAHRLKWLLNIQSSTLESSSSSYEEPRNGIDSHQPWEPENHYWGCTLGSSPFVPSLARCEASWGSLGEKTIQESLQTV